MSIPGSASPLLLASTAAAAGGYQVSRSLRFNSADSAYLSKSSANITTFTLSYWMKRCGSGRDDIFVTNSSTGFYIYVNTDGSIRINDNTTNRFISNGLYRDPSAWYHVVINNNGSTFNLYVNGVLDKSVSINLALYSGTAYIGTNPSSSYANFYLADIHFIDGQALTPSSFTEVSATTGQLIPKTYTGTFGTNGFWLKFSDNSAATAATLGNDYSGNNNDWTPNNLSVTAGAGNDSLVDTPTSYGTDTGVGGSVRGNYATWNPVAAYLASNTTTSTVSNGNLDIAFLSGSNFGNQHYSTIAVSSGKWYLEWTDRSGSPNTNAQAFILGVQNLEYPRNFLYETGGYGITTGSVQQLWLNGSNTNNWWSGTPAQNDIYGIVLDCDNSTISFYRNNSSLGSSQSIPAGKTYAFAITAYQGQGTPTGSANWGQRAFAYTAPSGFKALCDTNLGAPLVAKPNQHFDAITYTGNGSTLTIPNVNSTPTSIAFDPGFIWFKQRASPKRDHNVYDVIRGTTKLLSTNGTSGDASTYDVYPGDGVEQTVSGLTAFNTGSKTVDVGSSNVANGSSSSYVAWAWYAGATTDPSNQAGSITSQVRANVSAGFSVVTYTGSGAQATVGHGLGVAPGFVVAKSRTATGGYGWAVYHSSLGKDAFLNLNSTSGSTGFSNYWGTATPNSTVFGVGNGSFDNNTGNMVAYCFSPVVGYSSFGSYTGTGTSDGSFIFLGFRPKWFLLKPSTAADGWRLFDSVRNTYNYVDLQLSPSSSNAEVDGDTDYAIDFLSNGVKIRAGNSGINGSGVTFVYAAFAENPFQYARAR